MELPVPLTVCALRPDREVLTRQRAAGISETRSRPVTSDCQNAAGLGPPGTRHPRPTTAMGSDRARSKAASFSCVCSSAMSAWRSGDRVTMQAAWWR